MMQYALFGHPVSHSLSPIIHTLFAQQCDIQMDYKSYDVQPDDFQSALMQFHTQGGKGANITVPLKSLAYTLCEQKSIAAQRAQAVNTLYWDEEDKLCGDNTDGIGFLNDIKNQYAQPLKNKRILILGAGGAAAGIISVLLDAGSEIVITNRTHQRAKDLVQLFNNNKIIATSLESLNLTPAQYAFDMIVNASSSSIQNIIFPIHADIIKNAWVYDLVYDLKKPTVFVQWAREQGAQAAHDGLGMLIGQAAASFYIWHKKRPDISKIRTLLEQN